MAVLSELTGLPGVEVEKGMLWVFQSGALLWRKVVGPRRRKGNWIGA